MTFSTRVLARDIQHKNTCTWRSAQEYLHVTFSTRILAHDVQHKNTCKWCSAREYLHVTFSTRVLARDVQHESTSTWRSAWEYFHVMFSMGVLASDVQYESTNEFCFVDVTSKLENCTHMCMNFSMNFSNKLNKIIFKNLPIRSTLLNHWLRCFYIVLLWFLCLKCYWLKLHMWFLPFEIKS